jgi:ABC-type bacteriocin/lantibiotic exporter with double-glycine peptidase domain
MSLAYHGRPATLDELRAATRTGRDGVDAAGLVDAAARYGLDARGVRIDLDGLKHLERGSILHWELSHFVVLDKLRRDGSADVIDPAIGRYRVPRERLAKSFTGVAIVFQPKADFTRKPGEKPRSVWRYVGPLLVSTRLLPRIIGLSVLGQLLALAVPVMTGVVVDRVIPTGDRELLLALLLGLSAMIGFFFLSSFVRAHLLVHLRAHLDLRISTGFITHLVRLPPAFFLQRSSGDLMMRLNSNATIREILTTTAMSTVLDGATVSLYLVVIALESPLMAGIVLVLGTLQVTALLVTQSRNRRLMSESLQAQSRAQGYLVQVLAGIETLKALGAEQRAVERWSHLFVDEVNATVARGRLSAGVDTFLSTLRTGSPLIILGVGAALVLDGTLSLGSMLAVSALAAGLLTPLSTLVSTGLQAQLLGSYMERINDVLDTPPEQEPGSAEAVTSLSGRVAVQDVRFSYDSGPDVLRGVSLDVEPGMTVAVVGRSGSGKSTLAHVMAGLYVPTAGRVLYDGRDLRELEVVSVRRRLGIVPQSAYLFGTSIRENIALAAPGASLDEIEEAARVAAIHDDVMAMPLGYETVLADGGASLSGGQRQRIALARALVHRPALLILDEATSALDSATEAQVYANLEPLDVTKVVIAHRVTTIAHADLIVVMRDGAFAEHGTHDELLAAGGEYAALVAAGSAELRSG